MSPFSWALRPLKRYAEFSGRSSRAEFWWFFLFLFIVYLAMWFAFFGTVVASLAASQANATTAPSAGMLAGLGAGVIIVGLFWLAVIVPSIAVQVRRLHDTDRSGWWLGGYFLLYAVYFAMLIGSVGSAMTASTAGQTDPTPAFGAMFGLTMILGLVMFAYAIALLVFFCLPGTKGANRFGDDPYGADVEQVFA